MIDIEHLRVSLGGERVLDGIDVVVEEGELLGVIGPNGAGKTTLLRTISGIVTPDGGTVRVEGDQVTDLDARTLGRRVAVVHQETDIAFDFTVREVVEMGRTPYMRRFREDNPFAGETVQAALDQTATAHLADRHITAVSGGERKRVAIARALAQETPILLLDEPTGSLDINHQLATFELIDTLIADERSGIAAVHDLDLAAQYCDRLLLLADGEALALGSPASVLTSDRIRTAYGVRAAVRRDPVRDSITVTPIPDRPPDPDIAVHVIGGGGAGCEAMLALDRAGYEISVGVVEQNGPEHVLARALDARAITAPPAAEIDARVHERHLECLRSARITVLADLEVGPLNRRNLSAASSAERLVVLSGTSFEERNHAGSVATATYSRLTERNPTVPLEDLCETVAHELTRSPQEEPAIGVSERPPDREL